MLSRKLFFFLNRGIILYYAGSQRNDMMGLMSRIQQRRQLFQDTAFFFFLFLLSTKHCLAALKTVAAIFLHVVLLWTQLDIKELSTLTEKLSVSGRRLPTSVSTWHSDPVQTFEEAV